MPEEGRPYPWVRWSWSAFQRLLPWLLMVIIAICWWLLCGGHLSKPQHVLLEPPELHVAELQLNLTDPQKDLTLRWGAGPALGRSFTHGPGLEKGNLRIHQDGIYRLHIQVTLANCSSSGSALQHRASLVVGICSPAVHIISLLRRRFGQDCTVSLQRLTPLARGDVLCSNLTQPLLPSRNADETFFGVQRVYPWP
ncbi:similar to Tumor necrosis factor ligand superfamily member 7 (CD27 ligand) (CD27-L) (CD70 antigen) [Rattus norvegicus]|uniref:CD70 antigen n=1 Tax=Rattus norvegicus TaxID=10116 RepID=A6KQR5_RAT|nr:CD70 antigen [Rattus norvegicus]EDL83573.1 similar to Tumor necrosis factor ligand superfamily member 7 (CD27 ligand) (CD27-L) (CD70 antigen) [Rattus norvegicus]|eukprot:NP_001100348.1 CD70 antigen [Rattus norvegicus]